eukprot:TRINITY_DN3345_c0_g1_i3.p1 TRINITY_DN3345_c0_g1~~TRINITY_DN3345_c0_g1_i3.p1  ORF type:complete len:637 (-),score=135.22 TRINITY_DN3345_c0_g1_i3:150-2060(-)
MQRGLVGSEMCIRDRVSTQSTWGLKIEASVCFFEIYVDEVRDLAKLFAEEQGEARGRGLSSTEELEIKQMSFHRQSTFGTDIYETGEGDAEIKGMSRVYLKSENDVLALLRSGFGIRRSLEKKKPSIGQRVHTVFVLRLEEAGLGSKAGKLISKIYFVDLAGSERYAKSAGDSEKYREATSISNELKSLERAFMALPNEGILPKETLLISTIKGLLQQNTNVTLVGHIIGTSFEESLSTLQYVERCKAEIVGGSHGGNLDSLGGGQGDQILRNIKESNENYKKEIEITQKKNEAQFEKIKFMLGLNLDLKAMMQKGLSQKDKVVVENHKQAFERVANFKERNFDLDQKLSKTAQSISKIKEKIDHQNFYFQNVLTKLEKELNSLITEGNQIKIEYGKIPELMSPEIESTRKKRSEIKDKELEEQFDILFSAQGLIDQKTEIMKEAARVSENARNDFENKYKAEMRKIRKEQEETSSNLQSQYEYYSKKNKEEIEKFKNSAKEYTSKKRAYGHSLREELARLVSTVRTQENIIKGAEEGAFTGGMRSLNIPKADRKGLSSNPSIFSNSVKKSQSVMIFPQGFDRPATSQVMQGNQIRTRPMTKQLPRRFLQFKQCICLLYTSPSPRDLSTSRMPSSA